MAISEKEKQILQEVDFLKEKYFTFDEPVPFCGLFLYPVTVREYNEFLSASSCLTLNKNDDPKGIRLTHLEYLLSKMKDKEDGVLWSLKFSRLLEMVFHIENGMKCEKCGKVLSYNDFVTRVKDCKSQEEYDSALICNQDGCDGKLKEVVKYQRDPETKKFFFTIGDTKITHEDFMRFRRFVMYQNLPDFKDDSWVHKEVRDDQAAKQELLSKDAGTATLERKILCVAAKTNYKIDEIYDMPMRKMIMLLGIVQDAMDYQITKTGLMSGMVSLKKGQTIEHWIYKKDNGLYGKAVDAGQYKSQIQNA